MRWAGGGLGWAAMGWRVQLWQPTRPNPPAFLPRTRPLCRRYADVIIPWLNQDNIVAIDLITEHIRLKLKQHDLLRIYPNLEVRAAARAVLGRAVLCCGVLGACGVCCAGACAVGRAHLGAG